MMIKWSELSPIQRDALVAETVFDWKPVLCDVEGRDEQYVQVYDTGDAYCLKCHGRGNIGYSDDDVRAFKHQIVPVTAYTTDINSAIHGLSHPHIKSWSIEKYVALPQKGDFYAVEVITVKNGLFSVTFPVSEHVNLAEPLCIALLFAFGDYFIATDPFNLKSY
jgi:hypothetical protein